jgi:hypothetical protein
MVTPKLRPVAPLLAVATMRLLNSAGTPARWRQASVPGTRVHAPIDLDADRHRRRGAPHAHTWTEARYMLTEDGRPLAPVTEAVWVCVGGGQTWWIGCWRSLCTHWTWAPRCRRRRFPSCLGCCGLSCLAPRPCPPPPLSAPSPSSPATAAKVSDPPTQGRELRTIDIRGLWLCLSVRVCICAPVPLAVDCRIGRQGPSPPTQKCNRLCACACLYAYVYTRRHATVLS